MKRLPIKEAKRISKEYDYDFSLIIGVRASDGAGAICTYGKNKKLCNLSAKYRDEIAKILFEPGTSDVIMNLLDEYHSTLKPTVQMKAEGDCWEIDCKDCEGQGDCYK